MSTLFDLVAVDLYSLACTLLPEKLDELEAHNTVQLRTRITEWLLINGYSTLHRFQKDDDGRWQVAQGKSSCESCRRKREEHTYKPKQKPAKSSQVVAGENFVTLNLRGSKVSLKEISAVSEEASAYYYHSTAECLTSCFQCLFRPLRSCIK